MNLITIGVIAILITISVIRSDVVTNHSDCESRSEISKFTKLTVLSKSFLI